MIREISLDELFTYFLSVVAEVECGSHFDANNPQHQGWLRKRVTGHSSRGARFFGYFFDDDTPVGFTSLLIEERLDGTGVFGQKSELLEIGVYRSHRGRGYGKALLDHAENYSRESGAYMIYMATYAGSHEVIAFYGRNGYVPVASLPDVHGPGHEGTVFMRKILK